jgi:hypothetical protein
VYCPRISWTFVYGSSGSASRLDLFQGLAATSEFGDDGLNCGGPDEGLGILVPGGQEVFNGGDKIIDTKKRTTTDALVG